MVNLPCGSWSCSCCASQKSARLSERVKRGFEDKTARFFTLTLGACGTLMETKQHLVDSWNRLRLRISRTFGSFSYFRVPELGGKRGRLHLHGLIDKYIPQEWLSRNAEECGFGRVCDIRLARTWHTTKYILKYLQKGAEDERMTKFCAMTKMRRYAFSRDFPPEERAASPWQTLKRIFHSRATPEERRLIESDTPQNGAVIRTRSASNIVLQDQYPEKWEPDRINEALILWKNGCIEPWEFNALVGFSALPCRMEENAEIAPEWEPPKEIPIHASAELNWVWDDEDAMAVGENEEFWWNERGVTRAPEVEFFNSVEEEPVLPENSEVEVAPGVVF